LNTLPNFFIVGAARSGTTSLDLYLSQHPEIFVTPNKETHFFAREQLPNRYTGPGDDSLNKLLIRDEDQYAQLFSKTGGAKAIGEASAFYLCYPKSAELIAKMVSDPKIIMVLREPVARIYSSYMFLLRDGRETLGFEEGLSREEERKQNDFEPMWWYKELSQYYSQVKHYLDVFGPQRVKVLLYEELFSRQEEVLREVFGFLGVKEDVSIDTSVRYNVSGSPKSRRLYSVLNNFIFNPNPVEQRIKALVPQRLRVIWASKLIGAVTKPVPLDPQIEAQLRTLYTEDVGNLEDLLQRDLLSWRYREPSLA
jgi:sulfotransferase family protein